MTVLDLIGSRSEVYSIREDLTVHDAAVVRFRDARERYSRLRAAPDTELTDVETSLGQMLGVGLSAFDEAEVLLRDAQRREL